jgi:hypothetical protein
VQNIMKKYSRQMYSVKSESQISQTSFITQLFKALMMVCNTQNCRVFGL